MIFEEIKKALTQAAPLDPRDPLAGLPLPGKEHLKQIRQGSHIGHQYHTVARHLVEVAAGQQKLPSVRRLFAGVNGHDQEDQPPDPRPVRLDLTDIGNKTIDALVRLEEAVWSAHGRNLTFAGDEPNWHDEAVLAQFYISPWRIREAEEIGAKAIDPVTDERFVWPLERVLALETRARVLAAHDRYEDLPLTRRARKNLKTKAEKLLERDPKDYKALYMLLWADFAESLYSSRYDLEYHPNWKQYADGRLAQLTLRSTYSDSAVDELIKLLFWPGYTPRGLACLTPWNAIWDHIAALISGAPFARKDWAKYEKTGLRDAA